MILFGHPTGNPNSHHAALSHFEHGRLAGFVVPWMPSEFSLRMLGWIPPLRSSVSRLTRRRFQPLESAPTIQGRALEVVRLGKRLCGRGDERLSYEANDWLMRTMAHYSMTSSVNAVHSYEDCSLLQFEVSKRQGKA